MTSQAAYGLVEHKDKPRLPTSNTGEFYLAPGDPDLDLLLVDVPDTQVGMIEYGGKPSPYLKINYVYKRLTEALGLWHFDIQETLTMPPDEKGDVELVLFGVLKAGGLPLGGVPGIGADKYRPSSNAAMVANAIKTARADAIKDAARFLGLGLNVRDDPKLGSLIERKQNTIKAILDDLTANGKGEAALKAILDLSSQSINAEGQFLPNLVSEEQLDKVQKALIALAR